MYVAVHRANGFTNGFTRHDQSLSSDMALSSDLTVSFFTRLRLFAADALFGEGVDDFVGAPVLGALPVPALI